MSIGELVEDSTLLKLSKNLEKTVKSLKKNSNHHDHIIALTIVVIEEVGLFIDEPKSRYD